MATGEDGIWWNCTTILNIIFLLLAVVLLWRFLRTGGRQMLAMMGGNPDDMTDPPSLPIGQRPTGITPTPASAPPR